MIPSQTKASFRVVRHVWVSALALSFVTSCAQQIKRDSLALRRHALDYQTEQVMDNLIRGSKGLMMMHVDLGTMQTKVKMTNGGRIDGGRTSSSTSEASSSAAGIATKTVDLITKPITGGFGSTLEDELNAQGSPSKDAEIYKAYLQFLSLRSSKERLSSVTKFDYKVPNLPAALRSAPRRSQILPGEAIEETITEWNGEYYYVPVQFAQAYFDLCLAVTGKIDPTQRASQKAPDSAAAGAKPKPPYAISGKEETLDQIFEQKVRDEMFRQE